MAGESHLSFCAQQARRLDHDRYLCALFAPKERRPALFALYAFNIEVAKVREIVSEATLGEIRLQWWRDALDDIYAARPSQHPVALGLAAAVHRFRLDRAHFRRLIDARAFDLSPESPATLAELEGYAEGTSAPLVWLALEVLGVRGEAAHAAGRHVGIAWALIGLVRAVPHHASQRRLYLPRGLLAEAGVDAADVLRGRPLRNLGQVVTAVLDAAAAHLAEARALGRQIPRAALPALLPAALADAYLARLRRAGGNPFAPGLAISAPRRRLRLARHLLLGRY